MPGYFPRNLFSKFSVAFLQQSHMRKPSRIKNERASPLCEASSNASFTVYALFISFIVRKLKGFCRNR